MDEKCKGCEDKQACVPFFVHENTVMHLNRVNKRIMLLFSTLLLIMCITVSFIVDTLVNNNTKREAQILEMVTRRITEVADGVQQQSGP